MIVLLVGAAVFHICCRIWISWYLLVLAVALPLFSLALSLPSMLTARAELYAGYRLEKGAAEYAYCRCRCGGGISRSGISKIFRYPPRFMMRVTLEYLAADHKPEYEITLGAGEYERLRINTIHCSLVKITCAKAYAMDYLGLFRLPVKKPDSLTSVIMPRERYSERSIEITKQERTEKPPVRYPEYSRELYELREYREGDLMRDVHWKMTAKTGKLIVREPERTKREKTAVTFDLCRSLPENDSLMELVLGASRDLLARGTEHSLCWLDENERLCSCEVSDGEGQLRAFASALADRPPAGGASVRSKEIADADVRMYIRSDIRTDNRIGEGENA